MVAGTCVFVVFVRIRQNWNKMKIKKNLMIFNLIGKNCVYIHTCMHYIYIRLIFIYKTEV